MSLIGIKPTDILGDGTGNIEKAGNLWVVTYHYLNSGFMPSASTDAGRWWALIIALLGTIFMTGILISVLTSIFDTHIEAWKNGELRYHNGVENHIVIIGGNELVVPVIKQVFEKNGGNKYPNWWQIFDRPLIFVQADSDVLELRKILRKELRTEIDNCVTIYSGGRSEREEIVDLCLDKAKEIYILGESTLRGATELHHDSLNMQCTEVIAKILDERQTKRLIPCHVLFDYHDTYSIFQFSDLPPVIKDNLVFLPFNITDNWAQKVLVDCKDGEYQYKPLDDNGIDECSDRFVHLIIVGMSRMGIAMATQAAHICHYHNFETKGKRTRITFIDAEACKEMDSFKNRFHYLFELSRYRFLSELTDTGWADPLTQQGEFSHLKENFIDIEWEFIEGRCESGFIRDYIRDSSLEDNALLTIAICLPDGQQALKSSLYLPEEIYNSAQQVLVYQTQIPSILRNAARFGESGLMQQQIRYRNVRPFGMLDTATKDNEMKLKQALMVNARYSGIELESKEAKDKWRQLDVALKWSSYYNVNSWPTKFRSIGCSKADAPEKISSAINENINALMKTEHNRWNVEKLLMGFRPLTDDEYHHLLSLPSEQRGMEKKRLKQERHAHLNICSYEELINSDPDAMKYDIDLCKAIPSILTLSNNVRK